MIRTLAVAMAFVVSGCVSSEIGEGTDPHDPIVLQSETGSDTAIESLVGAPVVGDNAFHVRFEPSSGAELVAVEAFMPAHGHSTEPPRITAEAGGYQVDGVVFFMPGRWDITLRLKVADRADSAAFPIEVE